MLKKTDYCLLMDETLKVLREDDLRPKLLLHLCCAPCSIYVIRLLDHYFDLLLYFYDPNIHPAEEYARRCGEARQFALAEDIPFVEGPYDVDNWFEQMRGMDECPEKGARCTECYDMRLGEAARFGAERGCDYFTTVLSLSPHKDAARINSSGLKFAAKYGIKYLPADFKKKDGFKKSVQLSREAGFYRQDYCGCVYSMKQRSFDKAP